METSASLYFAGELTPPAKSVLPTPPLVPDEAIGDASCRTPAAVPCGD